MQRILNDPDHIVDEMLEGFVKTHNDLVKTTEHPRVIAAKNVPVEGKVGVVTGGGSGHKPAFIGYVGKNMCDAAAVWMRLSQQPKRRLIIHGVWGLA